MVTVRHAPHKDVDRRGGAPVYRCDQTSVSVGVGVGVGVMGGAEHGFLSMLFSTFALSFVSFFAFFSSVLSSRSKSLQGPPPPFFPPPLFLEPPPFLRPTDSNDSLARQSSSSAVATAVASAFTASCSAMVSFFARSWSHLSCWRSSQTPPPPFLPPPFGGLPPPFGGLPM